MILKYTIDANIDEPIMLIDRHIGFDSEDGMGVDGAEFARELLYLDSLGKKSIQIRINSVGGSVMDGMMIYNAILKTTAKVDTYNVGVCASIAGVIFQAGRKRIMADYALLMMHNPQGGDKKSLKLFKESLVTMLTRKAKKTESEISKLMDATTWMGSVECLTSGLCDEIEESVDFNKSRITSNNTKDAYKEALAIINKLNKKDEKMVEVTNKLGLSSDASEEEILKAIDEIENKSKNEIEKYKADLDEAEDKVKALKKKIAEMEDAKNAADEEAKKKDADDKKNKASELIENHIKAGRIANKAEVKEMWINSAIADFDTAKTMLESLPVNKQGNKIEIEGDDKPTGNYVAVAMAEVQNRILNNK